MPQNKGMSEPAPQAAIEERSKPVQWEWTGPVLVEDMLASLDSLPPVYGLRPADYAEYVLPMTNNVEIKAAQPSGKSMGTGKYEQVTKLYFQVGGRQAMLRDAVDRYGWEVREDELLIVEEKFTLVRMKIEIEGEWWPGVEPTNEEKLAAFVTEAKVRAVSGSRWGIGKLRGGDSAWEIAETKARGRALGSWGFGLLPGSGLASFEEMVDADQPDRPSGNSARQQTAALNFEDLRIALLTKMEQLRQINQKTVEEARTATLGYIRKNLGVALEVTEDVIDFSRLNVGQMQLLVQKYDGWIREARATAEIQT